MEPTEKSPAIDAALAAITGVSRTDSIAGAQCVFRNLRPDIEHTFEFRDELSQQEYRISGICQSCQDIVFEPEDGYEDDEGYDWESDPLGLADEADERKWREQYSEDTPEERAWDNRDKGEVWIEDNRG
jgi:hypothetical protein